jgi:hypothetical protein
MNKFSAYKNELTARASRREMEKQSANLVMPIFFFIFAFLIGLLLGFLLAAF